MTRSGRGADQQGDRVDQQALGNSPDFQSSHLHRVFDLIARSLRQLPEAKLRGYTARRFSFNVAGGRCEACEGNGQRKDRDAFSARCLVECETCRGKRYSGETLGRNLPRQSISDVLDMTCGERGTVV